MLVKPGRSLKCPLSTKLTSSLASLRYLPFQQASISESLSTDSSAKKEKINNSMNCLFYHFDFMITRSEEHTSELQSRFDLVCRLLLEKYNPSPAVTTVPLAHV